MRTMLIALIVALATFWPGVAASGNDSNNPGAVYSDVSDTSLEYGPIVPGGVDSWAEIQELFRKGTLQNSLLALRGRWMDGQTPESIQEHRQVLYWLAAMVLRAKSAEEMGARLETFTAGGDGNGPYQPMFADKRTTADLYGMTYRQRGKLAACMGRVAFRQSGSHRAWVIPVKLSDGRYIQMVVWQDCGNVSLLLGAVPIETIKTVEKIVETVVQITIEKRIEVPVEVPVEKIVEVPVEVPVYVDRYVDKVRCVEVPVEKCIPYEVCRQVFPAPILTPPRGLLKGETLRSWWTEPVHTVLGTIAFVLIPKREEVVDEEQPPPPPDDEDVPCPPGEQPPVVELPPGPEGPPDTIPVPLEPNPPGPPPVTGPGDGGEVGTNTPEPSEPTPDDSTVPGQIPANLPPDTSGLLPPG